MLRLALAIAVVALSVDAFFYNGAFTRSAYMQMKAAGQQFVDYLDDTVPGTGGPESAMQPYGMGVGGPVGRLLGN